MVLQCPSNSDLELMMKMKETFAFLKGTLKATYSPSNLLKIARPPGFESGMQQDCSEFLKYLLDTLHEQEKSSAASLLENFESMVHKLFGGKLQATIQCLKCKSVSHNEESFTNLDLPFPEKKQNSENTTIGKKPAHKILQSGFVMFLASRSKYLYVGKLLEPKLVSNQLNFINALSISYQVYRVECYPK